MIINSGRGKIDIMDFIGELNAFLCDLTTTLSKVHDLKSKITDAERILRRAHKTSEAEGLKALEATNHIDELNVRIEGLRFCQDDPLGR